MILVPRPDAPPDQQWTPSLKRVLDLLGRLIEIRETKGHWTKRQELIFWRLAFGPRCLPEVLEWVIERGWEPPEKILSEGLSPKAIANAVKAGELRPLVHFFPIFEWSPDLLAALDQGLVTWGGAKWRLLQNLESSGITIPEAIRLEVLRHWIIQAGLGRGAEILPEMAVAFPLKTWPSHRYAEDFWAAFLSSESADYSALIWWAEKRLPVEPSLASAVHRKLLRGVLLGYSDASEALRRLFPPKTHRATFVPILLRVIREVWAAGYRELGRGLRRLRSEAGYPLSPTLLFDIVRQPYLVKDYDSCAERVQNLLRAGIRLPIRCPKDHRDAAASGMKDFVAFLQSAANRVEVEFRPGPAPQFSRKDVSFYLAREDPPDGMSRRKWKFRCAKYSYVRFNENWLNWLARYADADIFRAAVRIARKQDLLPIKNTKPDQSLRNKIWQRCIVQNRSSVPYPGSAGKLQVLIDERFPLSLLHADPKDGFPLNLNPVSLFLCLVFFGSISSRRWNVRPVNIELLANFLGYAKEWMRSQDEMPRLKDVGRCFWAIRTPVAFEQNAEIRHLLVDFLGKNWSRVYLAIHGNEKMTDQSEIEWLWRFLVAKGARSAMFDAEDSYPPPEGPAKQALIKAQLTQLLKSNGYGIMRLSRSWAKTWDGKTLRWFWSKPALALKAFQTNEEIPLPPDCIAFVRNRVVLRKLLAAGNVDHMDNFRIRIPESTWTADMWRATQTFIPMCAEPWTMHEYLLALEEYRPSSDVLAKILRRFPRMESRGGSWQSEVRNFLNKNPSVLSDPKLLGVFWRAVFALPKNSKASSQIIAFSIELLPVPTRWIGDLIGRIDHDHRRYRPTWFRISDAKVFGIPTKRDLRRSFKALEAAERIREYALRELLEFCLWRFFPLCGDLLKEAIDSLRKLASQGADRQLHGDLELCLFFQFFRWHVDGLFQIYNSLPEFGLRKPTAEELTQVGETWELSGYFVSDTCSFRIFVERLRQAEHLENINQPEIEVVVDLGEGRTLA